MKSWKFYAKKCLKHPVFKLSQKTLCWRRGMSKKKKKDDLKRIKEARAFEKKWGFAYEETWNLNDSVAKYLYPRLAYLRDHACGYPSTFIDCKDGAQQWAGILDVMTRGFYLYATKDDLEWTEEENALWEETMELFVKYYCDLWD